MSTILLVDDEKPMREFLAEALESEGHHVLQAIHGVEALEFAQRGTVRPDLVVSDVMMPLMTGVELCQKLKANPATADIPVILMSAAHPSASANAGADALLNKPFDLDALDALVARMLATPPDDKQPVGQGTPEGAPHASG